MKQIKTVLPSIFLYFLSTGVSFATFSYLQPSTVPTDTSTQNSGDGLNIDPEAPRTEVCPLNGELFTVTEREAWEPRRPLAVMINNHVEARPQSGITTADIVYEAIAEGGVTRFMGLFYCDAIDQDYNIAPVRSARTYFVDWASEYNYPIYVHAGGANCSAEKYENGSFGPCKTDKRAQAIEQIASYGWRLENDIDHMSIGKPVFWRDTGRLGPNVSLATEHTLTTSTQQLWKLAAQRHWTNTDPDGEDWIDGFTPWEFKSANEPTSGNSATTIEYQFWEGYNQFAAKWQYQADSMNYSRFTAGAPHTDLNTDQQIAVKNLVILFTKETSGIDDLKHLLYDTISQGDALVFQQGKVIEANWNKKSRTARTIFTDTEGNHITFVPGKIWISIVDTSTDINY